jgi:hypothetical protein
MMLDGGESAQLICKGEVLIETERLLPQAIGISAASSFSFLTTETPSAAFQSINSRGPRVIKLLRRLS